MGLPVHLPHVPPLWREGRIALEAAGLVRDPVWRGDGVPRGAGRPVLLIPGFLAGDGSLGLMTRWLREVGYRTKRAGIRSNIDCSAAECDRLEQRLEILAERFGQRVAIVGQSRGGVMARVLAVQRPDLVSGVVTLGSPLRSQLGSVHPFVLAQIGVIAALGAVGRSGHLTYRCLRGDCCERFREGMTAPFPSGVGFVCVYSRSDGIVHWRACLDRDADQAVEIRASHCGMSVNAQAYRAVAEALAGFAAADERAAGATPRRLAHAA
jgi:pimeloyl-ACP methyl ester carboxylesterase